MEPTYLPGSQGKQEDRRGWTGRSLPLLTVCTLVTGGSGRWSIPAVFRLGLPFSANSLVHCQLLTEGLEQQGTRVWSKVAEKHFQLKDGASSLSLSNFP
jgi:hypothetical protein